MTSKEAIDARRSVRKFLTDEIRESAKVELLESIEKYNKLSGLHIQLMDTSINLFTAPFSGVKHFLALVGKKTDPDFYEKAGFYGEMLVLEAVKNDLGTCWVSGSFDRKHCFCEMNQGESLCCVIAVGHKPTKQGILSKVMSKNGHDKTKPLEEFYTSDVVNPQPWFIAGMKAVQKAPSSMNKRPVKFTYNSGKVTAGVTDTSGDEQIDLGIAKLHFKLAAGSGEWAWGNNAEFTYFGK